MHDTDFEHEHEELYASASEIEGLEKLSLTSVGIDIGSSTAHVLFSRLTLRRNAMSHSTQFQVVSRELLWSSPVLLTPYQTQSRIDFAPIRAFVEQSYREAGFAPDAIDTGAVVITGEALKKENAQPIAEYFAREGGKFICASAGPHHEALLAAYGSGAVQLSKVSRSRILNIDIGGGTTKLSVIDKGEVLETAAVNIGARLLAYDGAGKITRLEEAGSILARAAGTQAALGSVLPEKIRADIAGQMAQTLISLLGPDPSPLARQLLITPALKAKLAQVDYLMFSGGVAEYIYGHSTQSFGDLGPALAAALEPFIAQLPAGMVQEPVQGIRATVIGASEYTVQISGTTNFASGADLLPLSGLKVVRVLYEEGKSFAPSLDAAFRKFDVEGFGPGLMISISLEGEIGYARLREVAEAICQCARHDPVSPVVINVEQDVANALGRILQADLHLPNPILTIDGIVVGDLDFVDIGQPLGLAGAFPVTVKSLLFASQPLL